MGAADSGPEILSTSAWMARPGFSAFREFTEPPPPCPLPPPPAPVSLSCGARPAPRFLDALLPPTAARGLQHREAGDVGPAGRSLTPAGETRAPSGSQAWKALRPQFWALVPRRALLGWL